MTQVPLFTLLTALGLAALPAAADQTGKPDPDCMCRAQGKFYPVGESICLTTHRGAVIATCAMSQNVLNWETTGRGCITSSAPEKPKG